MVGDKMEADPDMVEADVIGYQICKQMNWKHFVQKLG